MATTVEEFSGARTTIYIGSQWVLPRTGRYLASYNASTGERRYEAADAGADDVCVAVIAAQKLLSDSAWGLMSQTKRVGLPQRVAELISQHTEDLAQLETHVGGRRLREMRALSCSVPDFYIYSRGMTGRCGSG